MLPQRTAAGFTLIEIMVTIAILGSLVALYAAVLSTASLTTESRHQDTALRIAQQEMENLRATGYAALPASGTFSDPLLSDLPSGSASTTVSVYNAKTKRVVVQVAWLEKGTSLRLVSLATLITEVGGL